MGCTGSRCRTLYEAAYNGRMDLVKVHLAKGVHPDEPGDNGSTPLMAASRFGHLEIVKVLIEQGAKVNAQNQFLQTPLHQAAYGYTETVQYLLSKGADPNLNDMFNNSPLFYLSQDGFHEIDVDGIKMLIDAGALVNNQGNDSFQEKDGATALHVAAWCCRYENVVQLLKSGADPTIRNKRGHTAFEIAGKHEIFTCPGLSRAATILKMQSAFTTGSMTSNAVSDAEWNMRAEEEALKAKATTEAEIARQAEDARRVEESRLAEIARQPKLI
jgi:ankyrin repeat protein